MLYMPMHAMTSCGRHCDVGMDTQVQKCTYCTCTAHVHVHVCRGQLHLCAYLWPETKQPGAMPCHDYRMHAHTVHARARVRVHVCQRKQVSDTRGIRVHAVQQYRVATPRPLLAYLLTYSLSQIARTSTRGAAVPSSYTSPTTRLLAYLLTVCPRSRIARTRGAAVLSTPRPRCCSTRASTR